MASRRRQRRLEERKQQEARARLKATCERKIRYDNETAAAGAAKGIRKREGKYMAWYHCDHCEGWHVGHTGAWFIRKKLARQGA